MRIEFEGIVQGVGFRPFLHKLANTMKLSGWALNSSSGVVMEIEGERSKLDEYVKRVQCNGPALSRVLIARTRLLPLLGFAGFQIKPSHHDDEELTLLCPDVALCSDCRREVDNPQDHRHDYPFINCTNCGPRYTIVKRLPYDRVTTTMADFDLCPKCRREYEDVTDRRYHAQPVACADCGPHLWFETVDGETLTGNAIEETVQRLRAGEIVAIKGLGGFHLAGRADLDDAVLTLRKRKQRSFMKPLAVMVRSIEDAEELCYVSPEARDWLVSPQAPVVLMKLRNDVSGQRISRYVAPRLDHLGVMLPYTPLHHLLMKEAEHPLVMTSGNLSDEPIIHTNDEARASLSLLADGLLLHNRPIHARCDDSVLAADGNGCSMFRHSRGFSPYPIALKDDGPSVLALGGDIKTTFAVSRGHFAFLSPHLGDGEQLATYSFFRETWEHYRRLFNLHPEAIACDMHPGYHTGRWAKELANELNLPLITVQHHHAHMVSLQTELGLAGSHTAIVADGTGYGTDGTLWGGEILHGDANGFERLSHLRQIMLPGGDGAVREPWRIAMALLHIAAPDYIDEYTRTLLDGTLVTQCESETRRNISLTDDPAYAPPSKHDIKLVHSMLKSNTSLVPSSSLGRLFDGVSALLGVTTHTSYEGQGPMELECLARRTDSTETHDHQTYIYKQCSSENEIDWAPIVRAIISKRQSCMSRAKTFHRWVAQAMVCSALSHNLAVDNSVVLASGGCLQNVLLKELFSEQCAMHNVKLLSHCEVPAGDGGLALGILRVAQAQIANGNLS